MNAESATFRGFQASQYECQGGFLFWIIMRGYTAIGGLKGGVYI
jgi:hypothetical protein